MMQLQFYGAAGEVTGSCHIVTVGGRRLLLDCGLIQGGDDHDRRNREPFPFDARAIDAVVLSHAHIDHCGRLPLLRKRGFHGPIYSTPACRDLARILLADSASMAEREAERYRRRQAEHGGRRAHGYPDPLFTRAEATATLEQFRTVPYGTPTPLLPGVTVTFRDAGHILGSASVWLDLDHAGTRRRLVFSGDIGQYDSPILLDPEASGSADVVVMESTYGNRRHRERDETLREFGEILLAARRDGGNVLIPAFSVGRSQEILYELATHFDAWRVGDWRVFLDSPMAIEASQVYWSHPELYDAAASGGAAQDWRHAGAAQPDALPLGRRIHGNQPVAWWRDRDRGQRHVHRRAHRASPAAQPGRRECDVVFTGYQAVGTLGRALVEGRPRVRIFGEEVEVAARVHTLGGFSAHGDQEDLLRWHAGIEGKPHTFLVHGEGVGANGLRDALGARGVTAAVARSGQQVDLESLPRD